MLHDTKPPPHAPLGSAGAPRPRWRFGCAAPGRQQRLTLVVVLSSALYLSIGQAFAGLVTSADTINALGRFLLIPLVALGLFAQCNVFGQTFDEEVPLQRSHQRMGHAATTGVTTVRVRRYQTTICGCHSGPCVGQIGEGARLVGGYRSTAIMDYCRDDAHPLIAFHGEQDPIVSYEGGAMGLVPAIPSVVATWAGMNGCAPLPTQAELADVTMFAYGACAAGADTVLYAVQNGGHTWPGGVPLPALGPTTTAVDASSLALAFFKAHPAA